MLSFRNLQGKLKYIKNAYGLMLSYFHGEICEKETNIKNISLYDFVYLLIVSFNNGKNPIVRNPTDVGSY